MLAAKQNFELLLVEDSDDDAYFFERTLHKSGVTCNLRRVTNGAEAVELLQAASVSDPESLPRMIFLDLKMPILNGFEVLEWLRHQSFANQIQVIVLSGSEHENDMDRAKKLGALDYLVKPVRVEDLHRHLKEICPAGAQMGAHV